jgi:hypothetical protein
VTVRPSRPTCAHKIKPFPAKLRPFVAAGLRVTEPSPDPTIRALSPVFPEGSAPSLARDSCPRHAHCRPHRPRSPPSRRHCPLAGERDSAAAALALPPARPAPVASAVHEPVAGYVSFGKLCCKPSGCPPLMPRAHIAPGTPCTGSTFAALASPGSYPPGPALCRPAFAPLDLRHAVSTRRPPSPGGSRFRRRLDHDQAAGKGRGG